MKRVLITGASGFVGRRLVEESIKRNFRTYAGVRKTSDRGALKSPFAVIYEMDLSNKTLLKEKLTELKENNQSFDYIVHAAGVTKTCKKSDFDLVNHQFTRNLVEALIETDSVPKKFVYISSLAALGPGDENSLVPLNQNTKPHPISEYGKSKLKVEQYLHSLKDFPYLILRPTGVYGPGEKDYYQVYKSINMGLEFYIGSKEQHLSFVHVSDLSRLIFDVLKSDIIRKSYFVSDLEEYTAEEFNYLLKKELNKKTLKMVFPKALIKGLAFISEKSACAFGKVPTLNTEKYHEISSKNWLCDSLNLVEDFDFIPEYNLEKGVKQTLEWYKKENLL